jgi:membrane fusion protein (multidrug efflux system)
VVDGVARQRVVVIGTRQPGAVQVVKGLDAGEVIVTAGQMKLYDGASVRSVSDSTAAAN